MSQDDIIAFLSNPSSYGPGIASVERHETHGAIVFLAGDKAYKLKRAVHYPYMDFSTPALRRTMCETELTVNRRTAPQLYLEVRSIIRARDGAIRFGTSAEVDRTLDWIVVMRRFPQSALLEEMRKRGGLTEALMRQLADAIAELHTSAEVCPRYGGAAAILRVIDENIAVLRSFEDRPFARSKIDQLECLARKKHEALSALLDARRKNGFVRRCHGDLHLNNICLIEDKPVLFDAIEFNEDFSCIDVFYDLAFVLMDLEHHALRNLANVLLNRYVQATGDYEGIAALPLFLSCRAAVRAHVTATLAEKTAGNTALTNDAASLVDDAIAFLEDAPAQLIVLGGLSGAGKSTLARALAPSLGRAPGAIVLRSDVIRKKLCGVEQTARLPEEGYTMEVTARVYAAIAGRARTILAGGHSVIADAVYGLPQERSQIESAGRANGASYRAFWLDAPVETLERRIAARMGDASDATIDILHRQVATIAAPRDWPKIDVSGTIDQSSANLRAALRIV